MYHLIYVSQASRPMSEEELARILRASREHNARDGISGLLIYKYSSGDNRANFMQLLEGDKAQVLDTFARIEADPRHHTKIVLEEGEIPDRNFAEWTMGFRNVAEEHLARVDGFSDLGSTEFWKRARSGDVSDALDLMLTFYDDGYSDQ
ncbi:MAG: BLUF domain-containing protein [Rhodobiaceae bacterium]|nr:BLUF domain-containing protein [Rhodobiaceae bacterium]MCC0014776.1 BLUF domain-containing protein [Rhodobiaceae bacterium]MCC0042066.1 BLUF domain-containing protein [Rhodobiaceae bacterium]MCC0054281.1 BLUF domain-containing protein [Rhodobiaceae bacterium]